MNRLTKLSLRKCSVPAVSRLPVFLALSKQFFSFFSADCGHTGTLGAGACVGGSESLRRRAPLDQSSGFWEDRHDGILSPCTFPSVAGRERKGRKINFDRDKEGKKKKESFS